MKIISLNCCNSIKITLVILISFVAVFSTPPSSPISKIIAERLQKLYLDGDLNEFVDLISQRENFSESDVKRIDSVVNRFFESDQFIETTAAYLTALFSENELIRINSDLKAGILVNEYVRSPASSKLNRILRKLKPYLLEYLERKSK